MEPLFLVFKILSGNLYPNIPEKIQEISWDVEVHLLDVRNFHKRQISVKRQLLVTGGTIFLEKPPAPSASAELNTTALEW